jgi:hypothetical protein
VHHTAGRFARERAVLPQTRPAWSRSGRERFYVSLQIQLLAASQYQSTPSLMSRP